MKKSGTLSGPQGRLAIAVASLIVSILLYFHSSYFGSGTTFVSTFCVLFGFVWLGQAIDKFIGSKQVVLSTENNKAEIFTTLGMGIGFIVGWYAIDINTYQIWVRALIAPILYYAIVFILTGIINGIIIFSSQTEKRNDEFLVSLLDTSGAKQLSSGTKQSSSSSNLVKNSYLRTILAAIAGITAFIAALLQILQILKLI